MRACYRLNLFSMTVCDALLEILADHGVEYIFGIPGDAINELTEAIRKQDKIKFIHVMHEEAGAFAAAAQAKLSGRLAVCAGTAGPGGIHLLNGLYDAKMDHAPVLAITGQVETSLLGTDYQQEVNLQALFEDVTVYNEVIVNAEQMPEVAMLACQAALAKSGVAHLNIPSNMSKQSVKDFKKKAIDGAYRARIVPYKEDLLKAAEMINRSHKPCILAGIGARDASAELLRFAELLRAPIVKALRGKDIIPDSNPYCLGGTGLLGTTPSVKAMKACDLLIAVGTDFPYSTFYPDADVPVIQIDKDPDQIGRRHEVICPLTGDAKLTLQELIPMVSANTSMSFLSECQANMDKWNKEQNEIETSHDSPLHPQSLARMVSDLAKDDAIVCCDTGAVTVWGARHFSIKGTQRFTLSGDLATMAFGLSASIGAQLLYPERQVIALCGDGGFAMLMCDFATAVRYNLPVKIFIFNNGKLGLIQMEQEAMSGNPEFQTSLHNPDYAAFANICGGEGYRVKKPEELEPAVRAALASPKPCIVNVFVNPGELTMPPEVEFKEALHYMKAKIKEYFMK